MDGFGVYPDLADCFLIRFSDSEIAEIITLYHTPFRTRFRKCAQSRKHIRGLWSLNTYEENSYHIGGLSRTLLCHHRISGDEFLG